MFQTDLYQSSLSVYKVNNVASPEMDTIHILLLHSKYPISYNKKYFSHFFATYRSKVNTSLKNKICFENTYFPSKFIVSRRP